MITLALGCPTGGVVGTVVGAACNAATGAAGSVVGNTVGAGVDTIFTGAGQWVTQGASWLLDQVGGVMSATTAIDLGSGWFTSHEQVMGTLAAAVIVPMVCCGVIQAIVTQNVSRLARSVLVNLPLALLLTGVAVELVRLGLAITDALSNTVADGSGVDIGHVLDPLSTFLGGTATDAPAFVVFAAGLVVALGSLVLWVELVIRSAAVSVAVLFLPLALAALVWPAISHWCRRLVDTLVALILSKLVIVAILALGASAVSAPGTGATGFGNVMTGVAMLLLATFSPFTLLRLIPAIEAGAVAHLDGTRHRLGQIARTPARAQNLALDVLASASPQLPAPTAGIGNASSLGEYADTADFAPASPSLPPMSASTVPPSNSPHGQLGFADPQTPPRPRIPGAGSGSTSSPDLAADVATRGVVNGRR